MNILDDLQKIFQDVFDDEELVLSRETNGNDIEDWDSLAQIRLVVAIEKHFSIKCSLEEVQDLQNVGEMVDLVCSKLK